MSKEELILALMLKDEGETIETVIKSFHRDDGSSLYKELIVGIDNATSDNTEEIVRKYTDKIIHFTWDNDFAKARNLVIEECAKYDIPWIFFPDGHEALQSQSRDIVDFVLEADSKDVWLISPYVHMMDKLRACCKKKCSYPEIPEFTFPRPMFFRNNGEVWFKEAVHNFLDAPAEHKCIMPEISLLHKMPAWRMKKRLEQRKSMNVDGLMKQWEENKDNPRTTYYMANTLGDIGEFDKALEWYEKSLEHTGNKDQRAQIRITAGYILCHQDKFEEAYEILLPAIGEKWNRAEIWFLLGWSAKGMGDIQQAIHWFEISTKMNIPVSGYFLIPEMYTWFPWDGLMECKASIGDIEGALKAAKVIKKVWKSECETVDNNIKNLSEALVNQKADNVMNELFDVGSLVKGNITKDLIESMDDLAFDKVVEDPFASAP